MSGDYLELIQYKKFYESQDLIVIDTETAARVGSSFEASYLDIFLESVQSTPLPLNFACYKDEINFLAMNDILSIGSTFEPRSRDANQSTLADVVLFGLLGFYLSKSNFDAKTFISLHVSDISELFSLPMLERNTKLENSLALPFASIETRGALADYADLLLSCISKCSSSLLSLGHNNLAEYLINLFVSASNYEHPSQAVNMILSSITKTFPILDDREFVRLTSIPPSSIHTSSSEAYSDEKPTIKSSNEDDSITEFCFFKNARRLLHHVLACLDRLQRAGDPLDFNPVMLAGIDLSASLAAPSLRAINTVMQLGILRLKRGPSSTPAVSLTELPTAPPLPTPSINTHSLPDYNPDSTLVNEDNNNETHSVETSPILPTSSEPTRADVTEAITADLLHPLQLQKLTTVGWLSARVAAVLSVHILHEAIVPSLSDEGLRKLADANVKLTPLTLSIFLDSLCDNKKLVIPDGDCDKF